MSYRQEIVGDTIYCRALYSYFFSIFDGTLTASWENGAFAECAHLRISPFYFSWTKIRNEKYAISSESNFVSCLAVAIQGTSVTNRTELS